MSSQRRRRGHASWLVWLPRCGGLLAATAAGSDAFAQCEVTKLLASDAEAQARLGWSVGISGDTAIAGAINENAAYVFERTPGARGDGWVEIAVLVQDDPTCGCDEFGRASDVKGDTAVVGAPGSDPAFRDRGAVYVFERNQPGENEWGQTARLLAADTSSFDQLGYSVAVDGDTILAGAPGNGVGGVRSGTAYVFERGAATGPWMEAATLVALDAAHDDEFGRAVALSGDVAIVGAEHKDERTGAAYVFHRNQGGPGVWGQVARLEVPDAREQDFAGRSVAIDADTAIVGVPADIGSRRGTAYIYRRDAGGNDQWGLIAQVPPVNAPDLLGNAVGISGDFAVVAAVVGHGAADGSGVVRVHHRNEGGPDAWGEVTFLVAPDGAYSDFFGRSVAIDGTTALVGADGNDDHGLHSGSVYFFPGLPDTDCNGNGICDLEDIAAETSPDCNANGVPDECEIATERAPDCNVNEIPDACDIASRTSEDVNGNGIPDECADCEAARLLAADPPSEDLFAWSVAIAGETALVGEPGEAELGPGSGVASVFKRNEGGPVNWGLKKQILREDGTEGDRFGEAVDLDQDTAFAGAPGDDAVFPDAGSASVLERDAGGPDAWGEVDRLVPLFSGWGHEAGSAVAVGGDRAIIGAPDRRNPCCLKDPYFGVCGVEVCRLVVCAVDPACCESEWSESCVRMAETLCGDLCVVDPLANVGIATIFERDAGVWSEVVTLFASDRQPGDAFGRSVAIGGDLAIVGAPLSGAPYSDCCTDRYSPPECDTPACMDLVCGVRPSCCSTQWDVECADLAGLLCPVLCAGSGEVTDSGAAYVFERAAGAAGTAGTAGTWSETARLTAIVPDAYEAFGASVAADGDIVLVGAPGNDDRAGDAGAVYVFERNAGGPGQGDAQWGEVARLTASDARDHDEFGTAVAISGNLALVGAVRADTPESGSGAVYLFQRLGGEWIERAKMIDFLGDSFAALGTAVDVRGVTAIMGAPFARVDQVELGAAIVLDLQMCLLCHADTNADGIVDTADILAVLAAWGTGAPGADVNHDGIVDFVDLLVVLAAWGPCPP